MPQLLSECIGVAMLVQQKRILAKNRDHAYKPDIEIVHTRIAGTEVAYLHDNISDWSEGLNQYGIGIVNTALDESEDELISHLVKQDTNFSVDGAKIRYALSKPTIEEVVEVISQYRGGVHGHTLIGSPTALYTVERADKNPAVISKHAPSRTLVRTNHGEAEPKTGYTWDEPEEYQSSLTRQHDALSLLSTARTLDDILPALRTQLYPRHSIMNMIRETSLMSTSSQLLLNLTDRVLTLAYLTDEVRAFGGIVRKLPDGYTPVIRIDTQPLAQTDIRDASTVQEHTQGAALLRTLRQIRRRT